VSGPNYLDWRAQNTVLADLSVSPGWEGSETFNLVLRDTTAKVRASYTSASFFSTLGVSPLLGRAFLPGEDQKEGSRAAVLSFGLWQTRFAGDSNVIGQTLTLDTYGRRDYTIVGVMPSGFGQPSGCELWLPLGWMGVTLDERRSAHWHNVIARLKSGVTLEQAQNELSAIQARIARTYPGETIGSEVALVPLLHQALGRNLRTALLVLWSVVAGVLLIACANVASLMLVRAATRQKEIALRLALGAGRWRMMRQLLIESVVLAVIGGGLGVLLSRWGLELFIAVSPANIPRLNEVTLDGTALGFTLGISVFTGVLFGLAPAWQFSRPDLNEALKEGTRAASARTAAGRTRNLLVVAEVALSVVLLAGAGLMLQSFARMLCADRGFQPEHLLTAELDFSVSGFTTWVRPTATRPQVPLRELIERLRALPGVEAVGAGSRLLRRENRPPNESIAIFGRPTLSPEEQPKAEFKGITPDWLRALGARVLHGRDFTEADTLEAPGVVLINETLARRYFPKEDPIGQRLRMGGSQPPLSATNIWGQSEWSEIIGVVSDVKSLHPQPESVPEVYQSYWQWPMQSPTLLVRTTGNPATLAEAIRRETKTLIPNLPPPLIRTMDDLLSETVAQPRLQTGLLGLFAGLALLLAAVGLYGVLAFSVTQRQREIGVRMALGAQKRNVLSLVIGQGMKLALIGMVIGIVAALALTRVIRGLLYGVTPTDPATFAAVALVLTLAALLACWLPARRAAKVNPMEALRYE
jgi:putative ABC transport system permease protein